jgi:alkylation response protein AidB-like acyl-CoA dehydrogenase
VVGVRLNFDKRYITLAPVATIIGLAFRLYDPDGLLGDVKDRGITLALVPRGTPAWTSAAATSRSTARSRTARSTARTCSCRCRR